MNKKNDKRLCWNCEGNVSLHFSQCPYCGVNLDSPPEGMAKSFSSLEKEEIPKPPYGGELFEKNFTVSEEEWEDALDHDKDSEEETDPFSKKEIIALIMLLPGVVFLLFGCALFFFSTGGALTLQWNQNLAYFYFLGAAPLLFLGWRALR